jgi:hypothetical protein
MQKLRRTLESFQSGIAFRKTLQRHMRIVQGSCDLLAYDVK